MPDMYILKYCSPTLAGIKTGSLFRAECDDIGIFRTEIRDLNRRLRNKGLRVIPIAYIHDHALIYIFRPALLERDLDDPVAKKILIERGYDTRDIPACICRLAQLIKESDGFPHEIGLFLGYPAKDVRGFMNSPTSGYVASGYWKVYSDVNIAIRKFAMFDRCRETFLRAAGKGIRLEQLAADVK